MPDPGTLLAIVLVGSLAAWAASMYLRDAHAYRAGRGDERYAWLRRSHPDHPALPPAPPKPLLRVLPHRWGWRHAAITAAQVAVVGGGMWLTFASPYADKGPVPWQAYPITLLLFAALVGMATVALTRLWDLASATLARRRGGPR
ncbi:MULTISPECIES: hypothetical protein [Methylobacterium]|uniref:Uncharacterized protein n=1 Tax=Methylobacterium fujisawaense TaxID=107400 RepID=A0ABR6DAN2_9HYPH|nr:hypothetical protein [Methylobacterium fujisawaense]MBA9063140.1 hypothetical protein [Methylobacterium fujisawaense]